MAYCTTLTDDEAQTFADIYARLVTLSNRWLWPDLLIAPSPDVCADEKRSMPLYEEES
jgi:hypothetical protein